MYAQRNNSLVQLFYCFWILSLWIPNFDTHKYQEAGGADNQGPSL
jgi:hypothetical protein